MILSEVLHHMYETLADIIHDYVWSPDEEEDNEDQ